MSRKYTMSDKAREQRRQGGLTAGKMRHFTDDERRKAVKNRKKTNNQYTVDK